MIQRQDLRLEVMRYRLMDTHDGSTHTHAIEHSHDHVHVINEGKHGHTHSVEELEIALGHRGAL